MTDLTNWNLRINEFATAVGLTPEQINEALKGIVGEPSDEGLLLLSNKDAAPDNDIKDALMDLKIPSAKLNLNLKILRGPVVEVPKDVKNNSTGQGSDFLPKIPDSKSFLEMLRTGGVLKVDVIEVLSAIKAAFGKKVGLYKIAENILDLMEKHSLELEQPCGDAFYKTQKLLTRNKYGDVLTILNLDGKYVSEGRKKEFFARLDSRLWNALRDFNQQLTSWNQSWMAGASSPHFVMLAMSAQQTGTPLPAGMMAPPDTSMLHTQAESFVNEINRIFAGPGIPIARALAYEATNIVEIIEDPTLPAQVGATNKDEMLKKIGILVGSDIVRAEQAVSKYALAIMSLDKVSPDMELIYLMQMFQLGSGIPWDKLGIAGTGATL